MSQPAPGLYRAPDGLIIRVLYSNVSTVHYWQIDGPDLATSADPAGKLKRSMPISEFEASGFAPYTPE